jgi:hypothetical protein
VSPEDHRVVRFVISLVLQIVGNAVGLIVAAWWLDDMSLSTGGLLLAVLIFTGVSVLVLPLIQKQAIRRSEALAGSSALVTCFIALAVTVAISDSLRISGFTTWIAATVVVWAISLLAGILLPWLFLRNRVQERRR